MDRGNKANYMLMLTANTTEPERKFGKIEQMEQNGQLHVDAANRNLSLVVKLSFGFTLQL